MMTSLSNPPTPGNPRSPADPFYQYSGRIGFQDPEAPHFYYAGSYITTRFQGTSVRALFDEAGDWWASFGNTVGFVLDDGPLLVHPLSKGKANQWINVAAGLENAPHSLVITKLNGPGHGSSTLIFRGLALDEGMHLLEPAPKPSFKLEIYGDSVTEGASAACPEGTYDCGADNGWYSYANVLARLLKAELHNLGIGGLAVRNHTGYYDGSHTGLEKSFDRLKPFGDMPAWAFSQFHPDLVILAMGVNDASTHGLDDLPAWKETYKTIVRSIIHQHGPAVPLLFTTAPIQNNADQAYPCVRQVADELKTEGLNTHFYPFDFRTQGHTNQVESATMAQALYRWITVNLLA